MPVKYFTNSTGFLFDVAFNILLIAGMVWDEQYKYS